jgi:predicted porin
MKTRMLVAATLAAIAAPAMAAEVVLYGIADITVEAVKSTGQTSGPQIDQRSRVSSNSSYLGVKGYTGVAGQKAFFQLEYGTNIDAQGDGTAGPNPFSGYRDSFVGIEGNWGSVKAGNLTLPIRSISGRTNYNPGSTSISETINLMVSINGTNAGFHTRKQNAIQYTAPTLVDGLTAIVGYGANEEKVTQVPGGPAAKNPSTRAFGLYWEKSFLGIYYAWEQRKDSNTVASPAVSNPSDGKDNRLIFRFDFGQGSKVLAGYDAQKIDGTYGSGATAGNGSVKRNAWTVAASQTVGQHEFIVEYAKANAMKCDGAAALVAASSCATANVSNTGAKQVGFVYHYWWYKEAMIQAYWTRITNDSAGSYDFDVNPARNSALQTGVQTGASPTGVGVGVRYTF